MGAQRAATISSSSKVSPNRKAAAGGEKGGEDRSKVRYLSQYRVLKVKSQAQRR